VVSLAQQVIWLRAREKMSMATVTPKTKYVEDFEGLHLYHGAISNCSMRVRMTMIEKGLDWTSHHIDLVKKENLNEEYFGIHPKGLVPTLVHDGVVHIESNDIIDYLDETYPEPTLRSIDKPEEMLEWLRLATSIHMTGIKPYIYFKRMSGKIQKSAEEEAKYLALQKDEEMRAFHKKFTGSDGIDPKDVEAAIAVLEDCFGRLEKALEGNEWILGDQYTLADISWVPVHFTLKGADFPFENYPNVSRWAENFEKRPSFQEGIIKWCRDFAKV